MPFTSFTFPYSLPYFSHFVLIVFIQPAKLATGSGPKDSLLATHGL